MGGEADALRVNEKPGVGAEATLPSRQVIVTSVTGKDAEEGARRLGGAGWDGAGGAEGQIGVLSAARPDPVHRLGTIST